MPVAPVVECVIFVKAVPIQSVGFEDGTPTVIAAFTVAVTAVLVPVIQPLVVASTQ